MGIIQEFKEFAVKGNALDMAVGIIIGAAFNKIVTSLVNDIIMPPIGMLLGGVDFKNLAVTLKGPFTDDKGVVHEAVQLRWGLFVNNIIDFLIVAFTVFIMVKAMNKILKMRPGPKVT